MIVAVILVSVGVVGEVKAFRFNRNDTALANSMNDRLATLSTMPRAAAYAVGVGAVNRRGFGIGGALTKGRAHGTTHADLTVSETTRANLMDDGLFSTYAIGEDTWRLIAMSNTAAYEWTYNLLLQLWHHFGADATHTGRIVGSWVGPLSEAFAPSDVSYATDRLKHILSQPHETRPQVAFSGTLIGRNAILTAELTLPDGTRLEMLPVALPPHVAAAVVGAESDAARLLEDRNKKAPVTA